MALFVVSALIGVLVGVLSGMLGIGGGMVMVPAFRLGYGMQALQATATSLFAIIPISVAGMVTHVRNKTCYPRLGVAAGAGGALTSPVGVYLASVSPSWVVMVAAAAVIAYSSVTMFRKAMALPKGKGNAMGGRNAQAFQGKPPRVDAVTSETAGVSAGSERVALTPDRLLLGAVIGAVAGLASGYVGVGGGFVMIPLFMTLLGTTMKKTSGTSLFAICILAIPGVVEQLALGNVQVVAGAAMAAGAIPGAVLGANLMRRIPERLLRLIFAALLVLAAIMLVVKEFGM